MPHLTYTGEWAGFSVPSVWAQCHTNIRFSAPATKNPCTACVSRVFEDSIVLRGSFNSCVSYTCTSNHQRSWSWLLQLFLTPRKEQSSQNEENCNPNVSLLSNCRGESAKKLLLRGDKMAAKQIQRSGSVSRNEKAWLDTKLFRVVKRLTSALIAYLQQFGWENNTGSIFFSAFPIAI